MAPSKPGRLEGAGCPHPTLDDVVPDILRLASSWCCAADRRGLALTRAVSPVRLTSTPCTATRL
eukprot:7668276-Pyramimonas_sp.AAC.1